MDDTDMADVAYDIDIDVGAGIEQPQHAPQQVSSRRVDDQGGLHGCCMATDTAPTARHSKHAAAQRSGGR